MTVRTDVTVDYTRSPRIITVAAPSTEISIQDLYDTLREIEDELYHLLYPRLIDGAGKEDLGGGVFVGLTVELQDAKLSFESRTTPQETGTATSNDVDGVTLIDTTALFQTNGVIPGANVFNYTTTAFGTVLSIDSEIQLTMVPLSDGTRNDWQIGDAYEVINEIQCEVTGGNLVGVDTGGSPVPVIFPTFGTQIILSRASTATLQELEAAQFSSFEGAVRVDVINGTSGTAFPAGTRKQPVDNFTDALSIAVATGLGEFRVIGNATLPSGLNFDGYTFTGDSRTSTILTVDAGASTVSSNFFRLDITGTVGGGNVIEDCVVQTLAGFSGTIEQSRLDNTLTLDGISTAHLIDCYSGTPGISTPIIDANGSGSALGVRRYAGGLQINNKTGADSMSLNFAGGQLILDSTVTSGTVVCRGNGKLIDNSVGATVLDEMVDSEDIKNTLKVSRNKIVLDAINNNITVYDDDDITVLFSGPVWQDAGGAVPYTGGAPVRRDRLT